MSNRVGLEAHHYNHYDVFFFVSPSPLITSMVTGPRQLRTMLRAEMSASSGEEDGPPFQEIVSDGRNPEFVMRENVPRHKTVGEKTGPVAFSFEPRNAPNPEGQSSGQSSCSNLLRVSKRLKVSRPTAIFGCWVYVSTVELTRVQWNAAARVANCAPS